METFLGEASRRGIPEHLHSKLYQKLHDEVLVQQMATHASRLCNRETSCVQRAVVAQLREPRKATSGMYWNLYRGVYSSLAVATAPSPTTRYPQKPALLPVFFYFNVFRTDSRFDGLLDRERYHAPLGLYSTPPGSEAAIFTAYKLQ